MCGRRDRLAAPSGEVFESDPGGTVLALSAGAVQAPGWRGCELHERGPGLRQRRREWQGDRGRDIVMMMRKGRRGGTVRLAVALSLDEVLAWIMIVVLVEQGAGQGRGDMRLAGGVQPVIDLRDRRLGDDERHQHDRQRRYARHPRLPSPKDQNPLPCSLA